MKLKIRDDRQVETHYFTRRVILEEAREIKVRRRKCKVSIISVSYKYGTRFKTVCLQGVMDGKLYTHPYPRSKCPKWAMIVLDESIPKRV